MGQCFSGARNPPGQHVPTVAPVNRADFISRSFPLFLGRDSGSRLLHGPHGKSPCRSLHDWPEAEVATWVSSQDFRSGTKQALKGFDGKSLALLNVQQLIQLGVSDRHEQNRVLLARDRLTLKCARSLSAEAGTFKINAEILDGQNILISPSLSASTSTASTALHEHFGETPPSRAGSSLWHTASGAPLQGPAGLSPVPGSPCLPSDLEVLGSDNDNSREVKISANRRSCTLEEPLLGKHAQAVIKDNGSYSRCLVTAGSHEAVALCEVVLELLDLQQAVLYHCENARHLFEQCYHVQQLVLASEELQCDIPFMLAVQYGLLEIRDMFREISRRGFLARLEKPCQDQNFFQKSRSHLRCLVESAVVKTSGLDGHPSLMQLREPHSYGCEHEPVVAVLESLGGLAQMKENKTLAVDKLKEVLAAGRDDLETRISEEIFVYVEKQYALPSWCLCNEEVRCWWWRLFGRREYISWGHFWMKLHTPGNQSLLPELAVLLEDPLRKQLLQQHLERGSLDQLDVAELDFLFPAHEDPTEVVRRVLITDKSRLVNIKEQCPAQDEEGPVATNHLVGLYHVPKLRRPRICRQQEVMDLSLSLQDLSTNVLVLLGHPGIGRTRLASELAHYLMGSGQWVECYWVELQGVSTAKCAVHQVLYSLGMVSEQPDVPRFLAWLQEYQARQGPGNIGIILAHSGELFNAPNEQQQFINFVSDMLEANGKLQIVLVADRPLDSLTYTTIAHEVLPVEREASLGLIKLIIPESEKAAAEHLAAACQDVPLALTVVSEVLRHGDCTADHFLKVLQDPLLPAFQSEQSSSSNKKGVLRSTHSRRRLISYSKLYQVITAAVLVLPEELINTLLVLSCIPSAFDLDMACELLILAEGKSEKQSLLRQLARRGLLKDAGGGKYYRMNRVVWEVASSLVKVLDIKYVEARKRFMSLVVKKVQEVAQLYSSGYKLAAATQWSKCEVAANTLVQWGLKEVTADQMPVYAELLWEGLEILQVYLGKSTLQGLCQVCLEKCQKMEDRLRSAQLSTAMGAILSDLGNYRQAEMVLGDALELFWREQAGAFPQNHIARCYQTLGAVMMKLNKSSEAEDKLQQAYNMQEAVLEAHHPHVLATILHMVDLRKKQGKYSEALELAEQMLQVYDSCPNGPHPELPAATELVALLMKQQGRVKDAQEQMRKAVGLFRDQYGSQHPRVATALLHLATVASTRGEQAEAEQTIRSALSIRQSSLGQNHPETAACLSQLVTLLRTAGKTKVTMPLAKRCVAIRERAGAEGGMELAAALQMMAEVLMDLGSYSQAESYCSRAIGIVTKGTWTGKNQRLVSLHNLRALNLLLMGQPQEAHQVLTTNIELTKKVFGSVHPALASGYNCMAEVLKDLNRLDEAMSVCRQGLQMREKLFHEDHPLVSLSLNTMAGILRLQGSKEKALEIIERCISNRSKVPKVDGVALAAAYHQQALILLDLERLDQALEVAEQCLNLRLTALGEDHPDSALSLLVMGEIHLARGDWPKAESSFTSASTCLLGTLGPEHPHSMRAKSLLESRLEGAAEGQKDDEQDGPGRSSRRPPFARPSFDAIASKLVSPGNSDVYDQHQERGTSQGNLTIQDAPESADMEAAIAFVDTKPEPHPAQHVEQLEASSELPVAAQQPPPIQTLPVAFPAGTPAAEQGSLGSVPSQGEVLVKVKFQDHQQIKAPDADHAIPGVSRRSLEGSRIATQASPNKATVCPIDQQSQDRLTLKATSCSSLLLHHCEDDGLDEPPVSRHSSQSVQSTHGSLLRQCSSSLRTPSRPQSQHSVSSPKEEARGGTILGKENAGHMVHSPIAGPDLIEIHGRMRTDPALDLVSRCSSVSQEVSAPLLGVVETRLTWARPEADIKHRMRPSREGRPDRWKTRPKSLSAIQFSGSSTGGQGQRQFLTYGSPPGPQDHPFASSAHDDSSADEYPHHGARGRVPSTSSSSTYNRHHDSSTMSSNQIFSPGQPGRSKTYSGGGGGAVGPGRPPSANAYSPGPGPGRRQNFEERARKSKSYTHIPDNMMPPGYAQQYASPGQYVEAPPGPQVSKSSRRKLWGLGSGSSHSSSRSSHTPQDLRVHSGPVGHVSWYVDDKMYQRSHSMTEGYYHRPVLVDGVPVHHMQVLRKTPGKPHQSGGGAMSSGSNTPRSTSWEALDNADIPVRGMSGGVHGKQRPQHEPSRLFRDSSTDTQESRESYEEGCETPPPSNGRGGYHESTPPDHHGGSHGPRPERTWSPEQGIHGEYLEHPGVRSSPHPRLASKVVHHAKGSSRGPPGPPRHGLRQIIDENEEVQEYDCQHQFRGPRRAPSWKAQEEAYDVDHDGHTLYEDHTGGEGVYYPMPRPQGHKGLSTFARQSPRYQMHSIGSEYEIYSHPEGEEDFNGDRRKPPSRKQSYVYTRPDHMAYQGSEGTSYSSSLGKPAALHEANIGAPVPGDSSLNVASTGRGSQQDVHMSQQQRSSFEMASAVEGHADPHMGAERFLSTRIHRERLKSAGGKPKDTSHDLLI